MIKVKFRPIHNWQGPLYYQCDKFDRWQDNLRAIALTLEALRKVERYKCVQGGQQYRGFAALPEVSGQESDMDTPNKAAKYLKLLADPLNEGKGPDCDQILKSMIAFQAVFGAVARRYHPDRGGDTAQFRRILKARDILTEWHNSKMYPGGR